MQNLHNYNLLATKGKRRQQGSRAFKTSNILASFSCFLILSLLAPTCTNYSSDQQIVNAPILLDIDVEGTGHLITVAAQNTEIGFLSYRLYTASTESGVRAAAVDNGIDCGPFSIQPNASIEYILEVKPNQSAVTAGSTNRVCAFSGSLTSGRYVGIRSLILSLTSINTSNISNVILVP